MRANAVFCTLLAVAACGWAEGSAATEDTWCEFAPGARPTRWVAVPGEANVPPKVTVVHEDAAVGRSSVRSEAVDRGQWQGIQWIPLEAVDLSQCASVSFWVRHRVAETPVHFACMIDFREGGTIYRNFLPSISRQWQRVELPLDPYSWESPTREVPVKIGRDIKRLVLYPYRAMDLPGEYVMVDGLAFQPRAVGMRKLQVAGYQYLSAPTQGDDNATVLTDGKTDEETQAFWREYANVPDIRFDLGGMLLVDSIKVEATAVPSQNISGFMVYASRDGTTWDLVGSAQGESASGKKTHQVIEKSGLGVVGRYVRIECQRPRQDFPLRLGEVSFFGRLPTQEEMEESAATHYDVGPKLPELGSADYWVLQSGTMTVWVHKGTGVVGGIARGADRLVERIVNRYQIVAGETTTADGYGDKVASNTFDGDTLRLAIKNRGLPGLEIRSAYRLASDRLEHKVSFVNRGAPAEAMLFLDRQVVLNRDYRKDGVYESWGSGHDMTRRFASEVPLECPADVGSVMSFENGLANSTALHYRYRYNDAYVQIGSGKVTWVGYGAKRTVLTPTGWRLGDGVFRMDRDRELSVETHLAFSQGTLVDAYAHYLTLPDVEEFRGAITRPRWLKDVRCVGVGPGSWLGMFRGGIEPVLDLQLELLREGTIVIPGIGDSHWTWGDQPTSGTIRNLFGAIRSADDVRERIAALKAKSPRLKLALYSWLWSAMAGSNVFKAHPDWFIQKDRDGAELSWFPNWNTNYQRLLSPAGSEDYVVRQVLDNADFYGLDCWYLDGGGSPITIDWRNMRMDGPAAWDRVYRQVRTGLRADNQDRAVFFNDPENPLGDLGFLESGGAFLAGDWRAPAAWMWKYELWQRFDPDRTPTYIYWVGPADGPYQDYMVGMGLTPSYISRSPSPKDVPYLSAQQQTRTARLVDAGIEPNWRHDAKTTVESVAFRLGNAGWVFVKSHAPDSATETVGVDLEPLGLDDGGAPVYAWALRVRDGGAWHGRLSEPEAERVYRETGWSLDRAVVAEYLGASAWQARMERSLDLEPGRLTLWVLTQCPALVYSVEGLRTQVWLPDTLGVSVSGTVRNSVLGLTVTSKRKEAEIAVVLPDGMTPQRVTVGDRPVEPRLFASGGARLALIPVGEGTRRVVGRLIPATAPASKPRLSLSGGKPGDRLTVRAELRDGWEGQRLLVSAMKDGMAYWAGTVAAHVPVTEVAIRIPRAIEGGDYTIVASDATGKAASAAPVRLADGTPQTRAVRQYPVLELAKEVRKANASAPGIQVTGCAWRYDRDACTAQAEPEALVLSVASDPYSRSFWGTAAAGLEMKTQRYIKLRVSGNFTFFNTHSPHPRHHFVARDNKDNFIGIVLDFGTPKGYAHRTAAGVGGVHAERASALPQWGSSQRAQHIMSVSDFALRKDESEELWLDLTTLGAPGDWDGRVWLSAVLQHVAHDRQFRVEVLESADKLPPGVKAGKVLDLVVGSSAKRLVKAPTLEGTIAIDGELREPAWASASSLTGFTYLGNPTRKAAQKTTVRLFRQGGTLHIGFDCLETGRQKPATHRGKPWENDSVELYLRIAGTADARIHAVLDTVRNLYCVIDDPAATEKNRTVPFPGQWATSVEPGAWHVELAVSLRNLGITGDPAGKTIGFNVSRNRQLPGETELLTLVPGNEYYTADRYRMEFE